MSFIIRFISNLVGSKKSGEKENPVIGWDQKIPELAETLIDYKIKMNENIKEQNKIITLMEQSKSTKKDRQQLKALREKLTDLIEDHGTELKKWHYNHIWNDWHKANQKEPRLDFLSISDLITQASLLDDRINKLYRTPVQEPFSTHERVQNIYADYRAQQHPTSATQTMSFGAAKGASKPIPPVEVQVEFSNAEIASRQKNSANELAKQSGVKNDVNIEQQGAQVNIKPRKESNAFFKFISDCFKNWRKSAPGCKVKVYGSNLNKAQKYGDAARSQGVEIETLGVRNPQGKIENIEQPRVPQVTRGVESETPDTKPRR